MLSRICRSLSRKARVWWLIRRLPRGKNLAKRSDSFGDIFGGLHLLTALFRRSSLLRCLSLLHFFSDRNLFPRFQLPRSCWLAPLSRLHVEYLLKRCVVMDIRRSLRRQSFLCILGC